MKNIFIYVEKKINSNNLSDNSKSALAVVSKLKNLLDGDIFCVLHNGEAETFNEISEFFACKIINIKANSDVILPQNEIDKVVDIAKNNKCAVLVFPSSIFGNDLAPIVSIKLDANYIPDINKLEINTEKELIVSKNIYAGRADVNIKINMEQINVFTTAPNSFDIIKTDTNNEFTVEDYTASQSVENYKVIENVIEKNSKKIDDARVIISCGRGIGSEDNFIKIEQLACKLDAAVGASRAVVDNGWKPHSIQVGQTGKTVAPDLYIACGISGAIQHLVGMNKSKYIIAINTDINAPIFEISDIAVNADLFNVIEKLNTLL